VADSASDPQLALSDQQKGEGHHVLMTQIKSVVQEVLGDTDIDDEADFLGLGMTSLTASEIARRLSEIIGCAISTSLVYEHPSVQELIAALPERAEILGAVTEATASPRSIPRRHEKDRLDDTALPMSFAQERIWVHHQALSEFDSKIKTDGEEKRNQTAMLNVTRTFVLYGPLNLVALQQALRFLVERHEILHTKFKFDHNTSQPTQVIVSDRSTYEFASQQLATLPREQGLTCCLSQADQTTLERHLQPGHGTAGKGHRASLGALGKYPQHYRAPHHHRRLVYWPTSRGALRRLQKGPKRRERRSAVDRSSPPVDPLRRLCRASTLFEHCAGVAPGS
jgi:acyl carrier protein